MVWIIIMTCICYRGIIEVSARLRYGLLGIEIVVLVAFSIFALVKVYTGNATPDSLTPSLSWLWPSGLSLSALVTSTLIAVFIYWGWDTAVSVNEETDDPSKTPGRAAIISHRPAARHLRHGVHRHRGVRRYRGHRIRPCQPGQLQRRLRRDRSGGVR